MFCIISYVAHRIPEVAKPVTQDPVVEEQEPVEITSDDVYVGDEKTFVRLCEGGSQHVEGLYAHCTEETIELSMGVWAFRPQNGRWAQELSVPGNRLRFDWPLGRLPRDLRAAVQSRPEWLSEDTVVSVVLKADATPLFLRAVEAGVTDMRVGAEYEFFRGSALITLPPLSRGRPAGPTGADSRSRDETEQRR